MTLVSQ
jgi:hypothetical protein